MITEKFIVNELLNYYRKYTQDALYKQHLMDTLEVWEINASHTEQPYREAYAKAVKKIKEKDPSRKGQSHVP